MQFSLISASAETLSKINEVLVVQSQTPFFHSVLEELAAQVRFNLLGDENKPKEGEEGAEDYAEDEDESARKIQELAETVLGECPEDRTEEEHEAMVEELVASITDIHAATVASFLENKANSDQLNVLADIDWSVTRDLTWVTSENGNFTFILK